MSNSLFEDAATAADVSDVSPLLCRHALTRHARQPTATFLYFAFRYFLATSTTEDAKPDFSYRSPHTAVLQDNILITHAGQPRLCRLIA